MKLERFHVPLGYSLCILVKEREIFEYTDKEKETWEQTPSAPISRQYLAILTAFFLFNVFRFRMDLKSD
jgi:hypothetical protein